ncbi:MAG: hypothetical protein R2764_07585 [Bacteroidales bacterium]
MVYTTSDNLESLPGFHLGEFVLAKTFVFGKSKLRLQAAINNIWNAEYQLVENWRQSGPFV